jgi:hypothetical protein
MSEPAQKKQKPAPKPAEKQSPPKCEDCSNADPERKSESGKTVYCKILQQWSNLTVMACGGKMFNRSVDDLRKAKGLPTLAEAAAAEPPKEGK